MKRQTYTSTLRGQRGHDAEAQYSYERLQELHDFEKLTVDHDPSREREPLIA